MAKSAESSDVQSQRFRFVTLVGVAASAVFVWVAFRKLDLSDTLNAFETATPWPWIPLAALAYLTGHAVRGLRCQRLLRLDAELQLGTATNVVVLGYAVNNVLPARMGEVARAGLLSDRTGIPFAQSLTVTLLERILDGWTLLLLFAVSLWITPEVSDALLHTATIAAAVFGSASVGILAMLVFPYQIASLAASVTGRIRASWQERVRRSCIYVSNGLAYLRRPLDALGVGLLSVAVWLLEAGMFLFVLPAFGLPLNYGWAVLTMTVTNLGILAPSTPGYVGVFHVFCIMALETVGVPNAVATSYAISVHAVFYVPITLWGVGVVMRYGIELGWMSSIARDAKRNAVVTEIRGVPMAVLSTNRTRVVDNTPGQLTLALTEAILPADDLEPEHPFVVREVATFVQGQINALPVSLRLMFSVGIFGFRTLVRLRHVRGFCRLPLSERRRIVEAWAYGRYALTRQLFRLPRSTAMLAYFDFDRLALTRPASLPMVTSQPQLEAHS